MLYSPMIDKLALKEWEKIIDSGPRPFDVFEWGCGGSSIWFGQKQVGKVYSVEHNLAWYDEIKKAKESFKLNNIYIMYIPAVPELGCRHSLSMPDLNFFAYTNIIHDLNRKFDFILVDGRARVICFKNACNYLNENGYIILHDSERNMYDECLTVSNQSGFKMYEIEEERSTLICQKVNGIVQ